MLRSLAAMIGLLSFASLGCGCMEQALSDLACERGHGTGCFQRGLIAQRDTSGSSGEALPYFARACKLGDAEGCGGEGYELLAAHREPERARRVLEIGCRGKADSACHNLGEMLEYGMGGPRDEARAERLYRDNCAAGLKYSCSFVARRELLRGVNEKAAVARLDEGCRDDIKEACGALGLARLAGIGGAADSAGGRKLLDTSCKQGWKGSCNALERLARIPPGLALDWARCALRRADACERLPRSER